ncbi:hypothetical protein [Frankia sp. Cr1]|uniref:hypothetical protein n=1 Tax=Frankia sp. Cr1 TaxID=3073931 RepID=UPI002AD4D1CA|nr:hypothetical protein [Frankia sp. Cr1]
MSVVVDSSRVLIVAVPVLSVRSWAVVVHCGPLATAIRTRWSATGRPVPTSMARTVMTTGAFGATVA